MAERNVRIKRKDEADKKIISETSRFISAKDNEKAKKEDIKGTRSPESSSQNAATLQGDKQESSGITKPDTTTIRANSPKKKTGLLKFANENMEVSKTYTLNIKDNLKRKENRESDTTANVCDNIPTQKYKSESEVVLKSTNVNPILSDEKATIRDENILQRHEESPKGQTMSKSENGTDGYDDDQRGKQDEIPGYNEDPNAEANSTNEDQKTRVESRDENRTAEYDREKEAKVMSRTEDNETGEYRTESATNTKIKDDNQIPGYNEDPNTEANSMNEDRKAGVESREENRTAEYDGEKEAKDKSRDVHVTAEHSTEFEANAEIKDDNQHLGYNEGPNTEAISAKEDQRAKLGSRDEKTAEYQSQDRSRDAYETGEYRTEPQANTEIKDDGQTKGYDSGMGPEGSYRSENMLGRREITQVAAAPKNEQIQNEIDLPSSTVELDNKETRKVKEDSLKEESPTNESSAMQTSKLEGRPNIVSVLEYQKDDPSTKDASAKNGENPENEEQAMKEGEDSTQRSQSFSKDNEGQGPKRKSLQPRISEMQESMQEQNTSQIKKGDSRISDSSMADQEKQTLETLENSKSTSVPAPGDEVQKDEQTNVQKPDQPEAVGVSEVNLSQEMTPNVISSSIQENVAAKEFDPTANSILEGNSTTCPTGWPGAQESTICSEAVKEDMQHSVRPGCVVLVNGRKDDRGFYTMRVAQPSKVYAYNLGAKASGRFSTLASEVVESISDSFKKSGDENSVYSAYTQTSDSRDTRNSILSAVTQVNHKKTKGSIASQDASTNTEKQQTLGRENWLLPWEK